MSYKIFVINPGSTSTKLAYFEDENKLFETNVFQDAPLLASLGSVNEQLGYRLEMIRKTSGTKELPRERSTADIQL